MPARSSPSFSHWFARRGVPGIVSIIVVSFAIMAGFLIEIGTTLDKRSAERTAIFVDTAIDTQRGEMERLAKDYAGWGEAYKNLHPDVNLSWAYGLGNMGSTLYPDFGMNFLIVISPGNATSYAVINGHLIDDPIEKIMTGGSMLLVERARDSGLETVPVSGILMSGGLPVLTTAAVISPGNDPNVSAVPGPPSVLLIGYTLTQEKLVAMGDRFFVPDLGVKGHHAIPAMASKTLFTEDGRPAAVLEWNPERPGQSLQQRVLPWLGGTVVLLALLTWLVLRNAYHAALQLDASKRRLAAANAKAEHLAMHDVVTGLPNRAMLIDHLDAVLKKNPKNCTALLYIDLDRFKPINDVMGHRAGDQVLIELARRLKYSAKKGDLVARVAGDEFVIAATNLSCPADAEQLCRQLGAITARPFAVGGTEIEVGMSIGVATAPDDARTAHDLVQRADIAMYQAKRERRGGFQFFSPEMNEKAVKTRALEIDLKRAVEAQEFVLHFQPRFDTQTLKPVSVEALVRWMHPEHGLISPAQFIPLAEETGLINPIGTFVLKEACSVIAPYKGIGVSVNISPVQFRSGDLTAVISSVLEETGLPPHRLEIELTEGVLLENTEAALETLKALKALGVTLAMDDFGTGYSSLGYLQSFPFDRLKIDRAFVSNLSAAAGSRPIIQAIVALGRALGMSVTAEGVETAEQLLLLRADQCSEVQGFFLAKPMPADKLAAALNTAPEKTRKRSAA